MNAAEEQLLFLLQKGVPLVPRPFAELGATVGLTEEQVLQFVRDQFRDGIARRLGAIFDSRYLGYRSALCAARIEDTAALEAAARAIAPLTGVTHCYARAWPAELPAAHPAAPRPGELLPNLWFTIAELNAQFEDQVAAVRQALAPAPLWILPAKTRFKIEVVFDTARFSRHVEKFPDVAVRPEEPLPPPLTAQQRLIVQRLEGQLEPAAAFYDVPARDLGLTTAELLAQLRAWQDCGVLRRIAIILRHREVGLRANAMCVWRAAPGVVAAVGRRLAEQPSVTHCYERVAFAEFPYNLYAMTHARQWPEVLAEFERLSAVAGLTEGRLLCSQREFKKTSMHYFAETK
jgi:DNA-binding Lrp family transcriptional regulator